MTHTIGKKGELFVSFWLQKKGYTILEKNWKSKQGEIDLIAIDQDSLVFIEVKNWPHGQIEDLYIAVGKTKKKRILETAKYFLAVHRQYNGMYIRFDLVFAQWNTVDKQNVRIKHIKDAFSEF